MKKKSTSLVHFPLRAFIGHPVQNNFNSFDLIRFFFVFWGPHNNIVIKKKITYGVLGIKIG